MSTSDEPWPKQLISVLGGVKRYESFKRLIQTRSHTRRRYGGLLLGTVVQRETGAHACGRAARFQDKGYGIRAAAGCAGGVGRTQDSHASPAAEGESQAQDQTTAAGDGSGPLRRSPSGGGPRKGFLAETRRSNQG